MIPSSLLWLVAIFLAPSLAAPAIPSPRLARWIGYGGGAAGSLLGLAWTAAGLREAPVRIPLPAPVPWAASELFVDPVARFFLGVIFFLGLAASLYAVDYMREYDGTGKGRTAPLLVNLLILSMAMVAASGDMLSFLLAWEGMSLSSYFLVVLDHDKAEARQAGFIYFIATHLGTGCIMISFLLLFRATGGFSFRAFAPVSMADPRQMTAAFAFALAGFGTKAGMFPLHIWLPHAHPEAPTPVSALMSGVMIKMGIYGIVRYLFFLFPDAPPSFGISVAVLGLLSGLFGVLYAIAEHDLKRLLAFHSVENIGIILLGAGGASAAFAAGLPAAGGILFAGALFHVLNHALFKGLLFLGAGSVFHATKTRNVERLGGLMRGMPLTGAAMLIGSLAISAVPPFNGFASEFTIYRGLWAGAKTGSEFAGPAITGMAGLALIGGLALVCFVKVTGTVFLGMPRTGEAARAKDPHAPAIAAMALLSIPCIGLGIFFSPLVRYLGGILPVRGIDPAATAPEGTGLAAVALLLVVAIGALFLLRTAALRRLGVREYRTWDCGFGRATPRMQYTASSFADPILHSFREILRPHATRRERTSGRFLLELEYESHTRDLLEHGLYFPIYRAFLRLAFLARRLHSGYVQLYLGYILATILIVLLFFR
ncbi:MAG: proton-conducting transporter membrane subunit [Deltaproteobacteria bacterium]